MNPTRIHRAILGFFTGVMLVSVLAWGVNANASNDDRPKQDHTCQGGHNCNKGGDGTSGDIDNRSHSESSVTIDGPVVEANNLIEGPLVDGITGEGGDGGSVEGSGNASVNIHGDNYPRQTPNAYFNYTPNFLNCGRVIGFQYGNPSGIGSFGVPWFRDKSCDIWLAVNEAQQNGHILLSYAFMCEIKNIKSVWGKPRCNEITATAGEWWTKNIKLIPDEDKEYEVTGEDDLSYVEVPLDPFAIAQIKEEQFVQVQEAMVQHEVIIQRQEEEITRLTTILQTQDTYVEGRVSKGKARRQRSLDLLYSNESLIKLIEQEEEPNDG